jgi:hypothetical protein
MIEQDGCSYEDIEKFFAKSYINVLDLKERYNSIKDQTLDKMNLRKRKGSRYMEEK